MPVEPGEPVATTPVFLHGTTGASDTRHSLRPHLRVACALINRGTAFFSHQLGRDARRECGGVSANWNWTIQPRRPGLAPGPQRERNCAHRGGEDSRFSTVWQMPPAITNARG